MRANKVNFIEELMTVKQLKQRQIAAALGVSPAVVSEWKKQNSLPNDRRLQLEETFDFSADRAEWSWLEDKYETYHDDAMKHLLPGLYRSEFGSGTTLAEAIENRLEGASIYKALLSLGVSAEQLIAFLNEENEATDAKVLRGIINDLMAYLGNASAWWDRFIDPLVNIDHPVADDFPIIPCYSSAVIFLTESCSQELQEIGCSSETIVGVAVAAKQELTLDLKEVLAAFLSSPISMTVSDPFVLVRGSEHSVFIEVEEVVQANQIYAHDQSIAPMLSLSDRVLFRQLKVQGALLRALTNQMLAENQINPDQQTLDHMTELFGAIDRDFA